MPEPDEQVPPQPDGSPPRPASPSRFGGSELWTSAGGPVGDRAGRGQDRSGSRPIDDRTSRDGGDRARGGRADDADADHADADHADADDARADRSSGSKSGRGSFLRELPVLLVVALVLAFLLRTFVLQVFYIPSSSMEPTLQRDDRMVVEKLTYLFREPRHGEIIVFEGDSDGASYPDDTVSSRTVRLVGQFLGLVPVSARDFVKRVIALPGDEVELREGVVFVNGTALDEPYLLYEDTSDFGPLTVPDDELFFLGDNRPNSSDSRSTLGTVPRDHVVGRSVLIIWPFDNAGRLTGVEHDVPAPDPDRDGGADADADDVDTDHADVEVAARRARVP